MGEVFTRLRAGVATQRGTRHAENEDSFLVDTEKGLFAVSDGMSAYEGAKLASETSIDVLREFAKDSSVEETHAPEFLSRCVEAANFVVFNHSLKNPLYSGMGTTLTAVHFPAPNRARIAHVGDSRCYIIRDGRATLVTKDHSEPSTEGRKSARLRQAVGVTESVDVDQDTIDLTSTDILVLCTDGVSDALNESELGRLVSTRLANHTPHATIAEELVTYARRQGSADDATAIVIQIG